MKKWMSGIGLVSSMVLLAPALASAISISAQSISPGTTIVARTNITFSIMGDGFWPRIFNLHDAFGTSTVSSSNFSASGQFSWTPTVSDVGTHTLSITGSDNLNNIASTTIVIVVQPPPSISIQSLSPGETFEPGTKLTFTVSPYGFTNPTYYVGDNFNGTSVGNSNIDTAGNFSWTPDLDQRGEHFITIYATDALGHNAQASQKVRVGGPKMVIGIVTPGENVKPGQMVSFTATPYNFNATAFSLADSFSGSSVSNGLINSSGLFSWTPIEKDIGAHQITVTGAVGFYGEKYSATKTINVLGPNGLPPVATVVSTTSTTATTTSTSTPSAIDSLNDQIARIQAQILGLLSGSSSAPIAPTNVTPASIVRFIFKSFLSRGADGEEVLELQKRLADLGFLKTTPNGHFGPATETAVKKFQGAKGIRAAGYVGPATRAALNE